jgi:hypothetical protein
MGIGEDERRGRQRIGGWIAIGFTASPRIREEWRRKRAVFLPLSMLCTHLILGITVLQFSDIRDTSKYGEGFREIARRERGATRWAKVSATTWSND